MLDAADEQPRPSVDDALEIGAVDVDLAEQEGEYGDYVGDSRGEDFGAHTGDSAELDGSETQGGHVIDGGFDVREGCGDDRRVLVDEGEEVEADGIEVEHFLLELGTTRIGLLEYWATRGRHGGKFWSSMGFKRKRDSGFEGEYMEQLVF